MNGALFGGVKSVPPHFKIRREAVVYLDDDHVPGACKRDRQIEQVRAIEAKIERKGDRMSPEKRERLKWHAKRTKEVMKRRIL